MSTTSFSCLALAAEQISNLTELGYTSMTAIQAESLPLILQGVDVLAQAKTGSGKTAAFGIGLLAAIEQASFHVQALVICPTRELADQVSKEIRRLARFKQNLKILTLCGGQPMAAQLDSLVHPPHVVVGTPGRLQDHLRKGSLQLTHVKIAVLDEADRMLDMGFADEVESILHHTPSERQTLLFSATYPEDIAHMSLKVQRNPHKISVETVETRPQITQRFIETTAEERTMLLLRLLAQQEPESCVVFCNTKRDCQALSETLLANGISTLALHGDLEQRDRERVLVQFANHSCRVLLATDVAARGLDIKSLPLVVNFELPHDPEVYVHRIGRTGRANEVGLAISFCTINEISRAITIESYLQQNNEWQDPHVLRQTLLKPLTSNMLTLSIEGGRKAKIRAGDLLGALTGEAGLTAADVGKIDLFATEAYVAIRRKSAERALEQLRQGKIKGKKYRVWLIK